MPSTPSPTSITRLEALTFEPDRVSFILDGRAVSIPGDDTAPAAAAFRSLHRAALAEYERHPPPVPRPGLLSRVKSWVTKLLERGQTGNRNVNLNVSRAEVTPEFPPNSGPRTAPAQNSPRHSPAHTTSQHTVEPSRGASAGPPETSQYPNSGPRTAPGQNSPRHSPAHTTSQHTVEPSRGASAGPPETSQYPNSGPRTAPGQNSPRHSPAHTTSQHTAESSRGASAGPHVTSAEPKRTAPSLSAIQSTREAVYLTWQNPARTRPAEFTITCRLDSEVSARLQDCYLQLAKLGYPVQPLREAASPEPERPTPAHAVPQHADEPNPDPRTAPGRNSPRHSPASPASQHPNSGPRAAPDQNSPRHSPASPTSKHPTESSRGATAGTPSSGSVTLHVDPPAHSDSAEPADERLTHLRGTLGKTGLKIIEVGLGEGPDNAPLRWEKTAEWLARRGPAPAPAPDPGPEM